MKKSERMRRQGVLFFTDQESQKNFNEQLDASMRARAYMRRMEKKTDPYTIQMRKRAATERMPRRREELELRGLVP